MIIVHYDIQRFSIQGTVVDDSHIIQTFESYRAYIIGNMYDEGFVPRYDIDEVHTIDYCNGNYELTLSLYGIDIGESCKAYYFGNSLIMIQ